MREFLDEYLAIVCTEQRGEKKQSWKRKRERVHPILEDRKSGGEFHTLFPRLNDHERICQECFRVLLTVSTRLEARLEWSKPWLLPIYSTQCSCSSSFSHHSKHLWKGPWLEREWRKNSPWMPVYVLSLKCTWFIFYQTMIGVWLKRNQPYSEPQPLQFSITFRKLGTQKQPVTSIVLVQTENAGECVTARKA